MNKHLHNLMQQAGYAAPEQATQAQLLAELIIQDCMDHAIWVGSVNILPCDPAATAHAVVKRIAQKYEYGKN